MANNTMRVLLLAMVCLSIFVAIILFHPGLITGGWGAHDGPARPQNANEKPPEKVLRQPLKAAYTLPVEDTSPLAMFFRSAPDVACVGNKVWEPSELAAVKGDVHNLLIVVHGYVLNVTEFVKVHPGGSALKIAEGGVDGAESFAQYHQPSTVGLFAKFCIGFTKKTK
jgi:cytochrome b involved in lipid metabolism